MIAGCFVGQYDCPQGHVVMCPHRPQPMYHCPSPKKMDEKLIKQSSKIAVDFTPASHNVGECSILEKGPTLLYYKDAKENHCTLNV